MFYLNYALISKQSRSWKNDGVTFPPPSLYWQKSSVVVFGLMSGLPVVPFHNFKIIGRNTFFYNFPINLFYIMYMHCELLIQYSLSKYSTVHCILYVVSSTMFLILCLLQYFINLPMKAPNLENNLKKGVKMKNFFSIFWCFFICLLQIKGEKNKFFVGKLL